MRTGRVKHSESNQVGSGQTQAGPARTGRRGLKRRAWLAPALLLAGCLGGTEPIASDESADPGSLAGEGLSDGEGVICPGVGYSERRYVLRFEQPPLAQDDYRLELVFEPVEGQPSTSFCARLTRVPLLLDLPISAPLGTPVPDFALRGCGAGLLDDEALDAEETQRLSDLDGYTDPVGSWDAVTVELVRGSEVMVSTVLEREAFSPGPDYVSGENRCGPPEPRYHAIDLAP